MPILCMALALMPGGNSSECPPSYEPGIRKSYESLFQNAGLGTNFLIADDEYKLANQVRLRPAKAPE